MRQTIWLAAAAGACIAGARLPDQLALLRRYKYIWLTGGLALMGGVLTALPIERALSGSRFAPKSSIAVERCTAENASAAMQAAAWGNLPILNEGNRRFPDQDPVSLELLQYPSHLSYNAVDFRAVVVVERQDLEVWVRNTGLEGRVRRVVPEIGVFDRLPHDIHPEPIHAARQPESQDIHHGVHDRWVSPVQIGLLLQKRDLVAFEPHELTYPTKKRPTKEQLEDLRVAWIAAKHTKSNTIVLVKGKKVIGVGAGQMNRIESGLIAYKNAGEQSKGCVLASDAYFPFPDNVENAAKAGVAAIIQPGGSKKDDEVIACADQHGIAMVFTGKRHFKH